MSRSIDELVTEAKSLARRGTKELILIAQDLTYYGLDIYKKRNLSELLNHLADVEGIDWIRLQYAYPSGFPLDVLDAVSYTHLDVYKRQGSGNSPRCNSSRCVDATWASQCQPRVAF